MDTCHTIISGTRSTVPNTRSMQVCIQVTTCGVIVSEYFSSWDEFGHDRLTKLEAWTAPHESSVNNDSLFGGYAGLRVNIHDVTTGHHLYDEGICEFGPGPMWWMETATVLPRITMQVCLRLDGGIGVVFAKEGDGYLDNPTWVVQVLQRRHERKHGLIAPSRVVPN
jgi:hypothetical protein